MGTRGPVPKPRHQRRRRNRDPGDRYASTVTRYPCGCAFLDGYDTLGRQGWHRCSEHHAEAGDCVCESGASIVHTH